MHRRTVLSLLAALPFAPRANAEITIGDNDWKKVPATANAILAADVQALYGSPIGQKQGWAKRFLESHHAGLTSLPPSVENVLIAAQFDYRSLTPIWQLGLVKSNWLITLADIAKREGSTISTVADRSAVLSPRDAYFTTIGDKQIAVYAPADRQAFVRWLRTVTGTGYNTRNSYLHHAVSATANTHLVMAFDAADAVDFETAKTYLGNLPTAQKHKLNPNRLASLFTGLRGVTLRITAADILTAKLEVDFASEVGDLGQYLGDLLDDLLAAVGASIDDIKDWKAESAGNQLRMVGPLSPAGLNHLLMLFELPGSGTAPDEKPNEPAGEKVSPTATLKFYKSLNDILTELRNVRFRDDYNRYAMWFDTYAKKVDQLPSRDVDPELAQFGYTLAQRLRATSASLRGVPLKTQQIGAGAYSYVTGGSGGWGRNRWSYGNLNTNVPQTRAEIAKVVQEDAVARMDLSRKIDDEMAALKRNLEKKYKLVF